MIIPTPATLFYRQFFSTSRRRGDQTTSSCGKGRDLQPFPGVRTDRVRLREDHFRSAPEEGGGARGSAGVNDIDMSGCARSTMTAEVSCL